MKVADTDQIQNFTLGGVHVGIIHGMPPLAFGTEHVMTDGKMIGLIVSGIVVLGVIGGTIAMRVASRDSKTATVQPAAAVQSETKSRLTQVEDENKQLSLELATRQKDQQARSDSSQFGKTKEEFKVAALRSCQSFAKKYLPETTPQLLAEYNAARYDQLYHTSNFQINKLDVVKTDSLIHPIVWSANVTFDDQLTMKIGGKSDTSKSSETIVIKMYFDGSWKVLDASWIGQQFPDKTSLFQALE